MAKDTTKIKVVEKTPGRPHIDFAVSGGKKVTFGDDELTINLAARERDEAVCPALGAGDFRHCDWRGRHGAEVRSPD